VALLFCFLGWFAIIRNKDLHGKRVEGRLVILRKHVPGLSHPTLAKFVTRARRAVKLRGMVNVLVTSDQELRTLNRRFRGKDQATDVLSFEPDPEFADFLAGDIAISAGIARQNAAQLGHSAAQEIKILVLHGLLHLAGYDHEQDHGAMARQEAKLRRSLGLPVGLIERVEEGLEGLTKRKTVSGSPKKKTASRNAARAGARTR
jgi:probable rRNA maturation factor